MSDKVLESRDQQSPASILHDFDIEPTADEVQSLPHISDKIPTTVWLIVVCELCERFIYYGLAGQFQNYIQFPVPGPGDPQPGAIGKGQKTATTLTTFFRFYSSLTALVGAIVADQFLGKYKAIVVFSFIYMIGLMILVLTSIPPAISANVALPGLIISMIIIGLGTGGIKSNISPLMADQYTRKKPFIKQLADGRKKVVDPAITVQSMFSWFFWAINVGSLSSLITTTIEKYHSFWLSYLIPLIMFFIALAILILGRKRYIINGPSESLILKSFHAVKNAFHMRRKYGKNPEFTSILEYGKPTYILQKSSEYQQADLIWDDLFVDDLKQATATCRIFLFFPVYSLCTNQILGNLISQAAQMNTGPLPNDLINNIDPLVIIIFIPVFDKLIYPCFRKIKLNFHSILRITIGFFIIAFGMGWSAFVQWRIYRTPPNYDYSQTCVGNKCQLFNNITVAWQIPSYFFSAISQIFASVTALEYAYTNSPSTMKSIVTSIYLTMQAIGSALNFTLIPITVNPELTLMYTILAGVAFLAGVLFYICFRARITHAVRVHSETS
jgi:POT family proton-dependent oligopeptide transporter